MHHKLEKKGLLTPQSRDCAIKSKRVQIVTSDSEQNDYVLPEICSDNSYTYQKYCCGLNGEQSLTETSLPEFLTLVSSQRPAPYDTAELYVGSGVVKRPGCARL